MKNKPQQQNSQLTTRAQRNQIRLDKAARRYAAKVKRGVKTVRYY